MSIKPVMEKAGLDYLSTVLSLSKEIHECCDVASSAFVQKSVHNTFWIMAGSIMVIAMQNLLIAINETVPCEIQ